MPTCTILVPLSPREREVLMGVAAGDCYKQIAAKMGVQPYTVNEYAKNAMNKLAANTRAHAVAIAMRAGWID